MSATPKTATPASDRDAGIPQPGASQPGTGFRPRRLVIRIGLVVVYFLLIFALFTGGKGHTLLLDNKDMDGVSALPEGFTVSVDGRDPVEFSFGLDRDMAKVQGQTHRIVVAALEGGKTVTRDITIGLTDEMALLSIPKLVAGIEPAVSPFTPKEAPAYSSDPNASNEFTSPAGPEAGLGLGLTLDPALDPAAGAPVPAKP